MKEKNLLFLTAFMFFIIFSIISVTLIETFISNKEMSFHWENEQIITRLYQSYVNKNLLDEIIESEYPTINSIGFYNFYGEPLYTFGDARPQFNNVTRKVTINKTTSTIMIERDFTSPYDPLKRSYKRSDVIEKDVHTVLERTQHEKEYLIRYVAMDVYDNSIKFYTIRFRIIQVLIVILIFIIIIFLANIYKKNMSYRSHIESTKRLVVLGTAARTLSHEIKNPLSIIRLQSSIIKRSGCDKHDLSLNIINDEINRITELTERVTDFLRQPIGYPEMLNINKTLSKYISNKKQDLNTIIPEEEFIVFIDKNRFISIVDNLINNAIESESKIEEISVEIIKQGNNIQLVITDKGQGISKDNLDQLQDPFFTTKSKGSGLGLSIVTSYINAAKGNIKISSELNIGTTVTLTIPQYKII